MELATLLAAVPVRALFRRCTRLDLDLYLYHLSSNYYWADSTGTTGPALQASEKCLKSHSFMQATNWTHQTAK